MKTTDILSDFDIVLSGDYSDEEPDYYFKELADNSSDTSTDDTKNKFQKLMEQKKNLPSFLTDEKPFNPTIVESSYKESEYGIPYSISKLSSLPSQTQEQRAKYLMGKLQSDLHLTKEQAAGIAGNIQIESSFDTRAVGDGGKALGIAQWHPDRRIGLDIKNMSFEQQVDHLIKELQTEKTWIGYDGLNKLKRAKTPEKAAEIIDKYFERSSGEALGSRKQYANYYYKLV